jgi:hypothetical protein
MQSIDEDDTETEALHQPVLSSASLLLVMLAEGARRHFAAVMKCMLDPLPHPTIWCGGLPLAQVYFFWAKGKHCGTRFLGVVAELSAHYPDGSPNDLARIILSVSFLSWPTVLRMFPRMVTAVADFAKHIIPCCYTFQRPGPRSW